MRVIGFENDLCIAHGTDPLMGYPIPAGMTVGELAGMRFDGDGVIDVRKHTDWLIDDFGRKRLPDMNSDQNWPRLKCALDAGLRKDDAGTWRVETKDDILKDLKLSGSKRVTEAFSASRAAIAGTSDPVKLAEYADKASQAQAVIDGTASKDVVDEAESEASSLGLADAKETAKLWLKKAGELRAVRSALNDAERKAITKVEVASTEKDIETAVLAGIETARNWPGVI